MSITENVYKTVELTGSSASSVEDAVNGALARAGETIRNIHWFRVTEVRGVVDKNRCAAWQVTMKVGFTLDA